MSERSAAPSRTADDNAEPLRARLLAILAADVAGYSRLMAQGERATVAALDASRAVFRASIGVHGGKVIDMAGDSVLAVFETAQGAVETALAVQRTLHEAQRAQPEDRRMCFRIGVHVGDVIEKRDGTVYGDGVNIAARLEGLAEPGGLTISDPVHAMVARRIDAAFDDMGECSVKNIAVPVRAWRLRSVKPNGSAGLRFGRFELQPQERLLLDGGEPVALGARAFALLLVLVERAGQLVTRSELIERVWPGLVVEENNLNVQVNALRKALGGELIATVPGRGYRFTPSLRAADAAEAAPPPPPEPAPTAPEPLRLKTNLPSALTPLIGRDDELAALSELIAHHRLVTIVGAGGMGKTLLSQHLLRRRETAYRHGVCFVELAALNDDAALPGAIAAALDVKPAGADALAGLGKAVEPLALLMVLDNAEQMLDGVARAAAALLDAAPGLHLVVTSQAPLKLSAERVYRIGALAVPQGPLPAAQALAFGAVALFAERARAVDARFALTDASAPAAIELCRALDGLALAIELAAARAPVLGVKKLAESVHERLALFGRGANRHAPARQQTLRAALEWSHALLGEAERKVFRRLAVMAGSADLELVQQVVADPSGAGDLDEWAALDALSALVERSLVAVLPGPAETTRYRLLDSPRALALEKLLEAGEADALRERHARAVAGRFDAAYDELHSSSVARAEWEARIEPDLDNAQEALNWAGARADTDLALAVAPSLLVAWPKSAQAERNALADRCAALVAEAPPTMAVLRTLVEACVVRDQRPHRMLALAERAIAIARALGQTVDQRWLYRALCHQASALSRVRRIADAAAALDEARLLERADWPALTRARRWVAEASLAYELGDREAALRAQSEDARLMREAGNRSLMSDANLANAQLFADRIDDAVSSGRALVARLDGTRFESDLALVRLNLAAALLTRDDVAEARKLAEAGWPQAPRFDMQPYWGDYLALMAALEGRPAHAARLAGYADAAYRRHEDEREPNETAAVERARALARAALGEAEAARLEAEGAALRDDEIAALAFGGGDR